MCQIERLYLASWIRLKFTLTDVVELEGNLLPFGHGRERFQRAPGRRHCPTGGQFPLEIDVQFLIGRVGQFEGDDASPFHDFERFKDD